VKRNPGRILGIYIRDVSIDERDAAVRLIGDELRTSHIEMLLVADTLTAAEHAVTKGLITADALPKIGARKAKDEQAPTLAEQAPVVAAVSGVTNQNEGA